MLFCKDIAYEIWRSISVFCIVRRPVNSGDEINRKIHPTRNTNDTMHAIIHYTTILHTRIALSLLIHKKKNINEIVDAAYD